MISNVTKSRVVNHFENNGYKVEYAIQFWSSLDNPTIYLECFLNNVNSNNFNTHSSGAWFVILRNPHILKELDKPYIFCTLYDLVAECSSHQDEVADVWFDLLNEIKLQPENKDYIKEIDFKNKEVRQRLLANSKQWFEERKGKYTPTTIAHVNFEKPLYFNPEKCYDAKHRIEKMINEEKALTEADSEKTSQL